MDDKLQQSLHLTEEEVTQRAEASALFLVPVSKLRKEHPNFSRYITRGDSISEKTRTEVMGIPTVVRPGAFSHIILPLPVSEDAGDLLSGISATIIVVEDGVLASVSDIEEESKVPDYLSVLKELATGAVEPYWVHAVRLPTEADV